jgi:hypothetical protein
MADEGTTIEVLKEPPKAWWRSENTRKNIYLGVSAAVTIAKLLGYDHKFGLGLDLVSLDNLGAAVMFFFLPLAAAVTALWLSIWGGLRRFKNGKDPAHPAAPLTSGHPIEATIAAVQRLTGSVPKP